MASAANFPDERTYVSVAIPAGATGLSAPIDTGGCSPVAIYIPSTWVTASLTFQVSLDGGATYANLYTTANAEYAVSSVTGGAARTVLLNPADWAGVRYFTIRSGSSAAPVNQTGAPTLQVAVRPV